MATKRASEDKPLTVEELPQRQATEFIAAYANHVEIGVSNVDFRFSFFEIVEDETGNLIREKKARVVMSPQQAIAFFQTLNNSVENWKRVTSNLPNFPE